MHVLITGSSGLVGSELILFLRTQGHEVTGLVRREPKGDHEIRWNPAHGEIDFMSVEEFDAVVNLSGENLAEGRWTDVRKEQLLRSRVDATKTLVAGLGRLKSKPRVLVNASAIGFYGSRGEEEVSESSPIGNGFLPEICLAWETHAAAAEKIGIRTVFLRTGVVLTPKGGALAKLLPPFQMGVGGPVGGGKMWVSWITLDDLLDVIYYAIVDEHVRGPLNAVTPNPVRQEEFPPVLGRVCGRPASVPTPALVVKLLFGQMAEETIL